jgi:hypothetical protein
MWLTTLIFLVVAFAAGVYNVKATRSTALKLRLSSWDKYGPAEAPAAAASGMRGKVL